MLARHVLAYEWVCPICGREVYSTPEDGAVDADGAAQAWLAVPQANEAMVAWGIHVAAYHVQASVNELKQVGGRVVVIEEEAHV